MRDHNGNTVNPRDVLNAEELVKYYANRDRFPRRSFKAPPAPIMHSEDGYLSYDGGRSWTWEPSA